MKWVKMNVLLPFTFRTEQKKKTVVMTPGTTLNQIKAIAETEGKTGTRYVNKDLRECQANWDC